MFCHIMPHTLLQLPHSLSELSVKVQPWKPWWVLHGEDQRIKPRKPCNPESSQIYTWPNLSFSWFISLAVLVQNERHSRQTLAFLFTCEAWSRFAASGCDSRSPPPPNLSLCLILHVGFFLLTDIGGSSGPSILILHARGQKNTAKPTRWSHNQ